MRERVKWCGAEPLDWLIFHLAASGQRKFFFFFAEHYALQNNTHTQNNQHVSMFGGAALQHSSNVPKVLQKDLPRMFVSVFVAAQNSFFFFICLEWYQQIFRAGIPGRDSVYYQ